MANIIAFPVKMTPVNEQRNDTKSISDYELRLAELVQETLSHLAFLRVTLVNLRRQVDPDGLS